MFLLSMLVYYHVHLFACSFLTNAELLAHQHLFSSLLLLHSFHSSLRYYQIPMALMQNIFYGFSLCPIFFRLFLLGFGLVDGEIDAWVLEFLLEFFGQGDKHGAVHFWLIAEDVFDGVLGDFAFGPGEGRLLAAAVVRVGDLPGGGLRVVARVDHFHFTTLFNFLLLQLGLFC